MRLRDKVAIVTGSASGQGRAIALLFAQEGASVVVADIDAARAEDAALEAQALGNGQVFALRTDVSQENDVEHLVSETVRTLGGPDILVNCAGRLGPLGKPTADLLTREEWNETLAVNLIDPWLAIKYAAPAMREKGGGSIISVASTAGLRPFPGAAPCCVSKAAPLMVTKTVGLEYTVDGIRANAICPGHIDTPMMDRAIADREASGLHDARTKVHTESNALHRLGSPEEVAAVALFLASEDSSFAAGSYVLADGGCMAG